MAGDFVDQVHEAAGTGLTKAQARSVNMAVELENKARSNKRASLRGPGGLRRGTTSSLSPTTKISGRADDDGDDDGDGDGGGAMADAEVCDVTARTHVYVWALLLRHALWEPWPVAMGTAPKHLPRYVTRARWTFAHTHPLTTHLPPA